MSIADPSSRSRFGLWRHLKTDHLYEILTFALQEHDLCPVVVYLSVQNGQIWTRPVTEFFDGRFVRVEG